MTLENAAKKISDSYMVLLTAVLLGLLGMAASEIIFGVFSKTDPSGLYRFSKGLGSTGAFLAFTALTFFPVRKIGTVFKKKYKFAASAFYRQVMKITAFLHPVIALAAFFLLFLHGFIFLKVLFGFNFTRIIYMGMGALSALTVLFLSGTFLKRKLTRKKLRIFHFSIACTFIIFFTLHMLARI